MNTYNMERFLKYPDGFEATAFQILFPQIKGLNLNEEESYFALSGVEEASSYLNHETLGKGLIKITNKILSIPANYGVEVFGIEDSRILLASMTLFSHVENAPECFKEVIDNFFDGYYDEQTVQIIDDNEAIAHAKKLGFDIKPENIIRFDYNPSRPVDEQLEECKKIIIDAIENIQNEK